MIKFTANKTRELRNYPLRPVLRIRRITFSTENTDWARQLAGTYLTIKVTCYNHNKTEIGSRSEQLPLSVYITPYHIQPVMEMNRFFKYPDPSPAENEPSNSWQIEVTLNNISLADKESLSVLTLDSNYIISRVDDWEKRVTDFIGTVSSWLEGEEHFSVKEGRKQAMHEGLMKDFDIPKRDIPTADVLKKEKVVMSIKPFGLWIIGSNGRIDLLTASGNYIVVDHSEKLTPPNWKLYSMSSRQHPVDFNKNKFLKILGI